MEDGSGTFDRDEIYSKVIRAGKRTYFFDIKSTRGRDLYLTITESKKRFKEDGSAFYEKHKIFLYKEDFEKFNDGFQDALNKIADLKKNDIRFNNVESNQNSGSQQYTDVSFDDLGKE
ncbi:MAG: DUF3276 family protein [Bacteroidota bacterium]